MNNNSKPPVYAVRVENGHAVVYDGHSGRRLNYLSRNVVSAQITGDCVQCNLANGRMEVREVKSGFLLSVR